MNNVTQIKKKRNKESVQADHIHSTAERALDAGLTTGFVAGLLIAEAIQLMAGNFEDPEGAIIAQLERAKAGRNKPKIILPN